jgi:glutamate dehydrogenase/leucine dehydrogenase
MSNSAFVTSQVVLHRAAQAGGIHPNVVRYLEQPKRIFEFTIPLRMDDGRLEIFTAYRVHYCDALGQVKDGTRVVPDLDLDIVKALGFWMTIKHAIAGIPAGGGKGGIKADPSKLSEREYEALIRGFIRKLPLKGTWVDIPGADLGTSGKTMAWMLDELEEIQGFHSPAAINDKPAAVNGTVLSREATGTGAYFVMREIIRDIGLPKGARVAVQGFGNVGRVATELMAAEGYRIVAVADITGGSRNPGGLDIAALGSHLDTTGALRGFAGGEEIDSREVLETDCDILIPAAVQNVIHGENAGRIQAKLIVECANGPVTPEAEAILEKAGKTIVPDVLTNSGSAIVCSFERTQGLTDDYWDEETVRTKLEARIVSAYHSTRDTAKEFNANLRDGAWICGLRRIERAMKSRGWL